MNWMFESFQRYAFAQIFCNNRIVLDVGCKYGYGTKHLAQVARHVLGLDINKDRINYCKENNKEKNIDYETINVEKCIAYFRQSDIIVCLEVIEHLKNPIDFINQIPVLLNDNGLFIFSVPKGNRNIKEHKHIFETMFDIKKIIQPYMDIKYLGIQEPMSFIGIAKQHI